MPGKIIKKLIIEMPLDILIGIVGKYTGFDFGIEFYAVNGVVAQFFVYHEIFMVII
jgi:hypothetical protein